MLDELQFLWWPLAVLYCTCIRAKSKLGFFLCICTVRNKVTTTTIYYFLVDLYDPFNNILLGCLTGTVDSCTHMTTVIMTWFITSLWPSDRDLCKHWLVACWPEAISRTNADISSMGFHIIHPGPISQEKFNMLICKPGSNVVFSTIDTSPRGQWGNNMILHIVLLWLRQLRLGPHTSPSQMSYGVSIICILKKNWPWENLTENQEN